MNGSPSVCFRVIELSRTMISCPRWLPLRNLQDYQTLSGMFKYEFWEFRGSTSLAWSDCSGL